MFNIQYNKTLQHSLPETNLLRLILLVLHINFQLLANKRKEQWESKRHQSLPTLLTGSSRTKFLAACYR